MTVKMDTGTAILCRKMELNCIKVEMRKRPIDLDGKLMYPYNIERGGIATILVSLPLEERLEKYLNETEILYEAGDSLNGKKLWACSNKPNRARDKIIGTSEARSGRHSRQLMEVKGDLVYAVIVSSWDSKNIEILPLDYAKELSSGEMENYSILT